LQQPSAPVAATFVAKEMSQSFSAHITLNHSVAKGDLFRLTVCPSTRQTREPRLKVL